MDLASPGYSAAQALRCGGREPVRQALVAARERTLALAQAYAQTLEANKFRVPYRPTINPPLWELGHIAWFQEYWVGRNRERSLGIGCEPDHPRLAPLFSEVDAFYNSSQVAHRLRWELPLPGADETQDYLAATLSQTLEALDRLAPDPGDDDLYYFRLVVLHEEMHAEAAAYMARALGIDLPALPPAAPLRGGGAALRVPAQTFRLGYSGPGFAFDNELGAHEVSLDSFAIDAEPVSWSRFVPFVRAGGYRQRPWWSEAGWAWLQAGGVPAQSDEVDPSTAAVHLTAHEAEAWCRWAGRRLPTEAEWECAAVTLPGFAWGQVWEWTASPFRPYPGFVAHPYRDYSAPWFDTRRVLRGAARATSPVLAHPRYRNFFEPHRSDVFAGFRSCV